MSGETSLSVHIEKWPLHTPFRVTGLKWTDLNAVVVEIERGGNVGRGEAAGVYYKNETAASLYDEIQNVAGEIEKGISRESLSELLPPGGARNAIDCALWDLEAKERGTSVWAMSGIDYAPVQTVMTIGIRDRAKDMGDLARDLSRFPVLKVKLDEHQPVERLTAIRKARPDADIVVDANQGFSFELLRDVLPDVAKLGIAMVEQPLPRGGDDCLEGFESPVPLCADESCLHLGELEQAARRYQMINIKLDKCGGLTEGLVLAKAARERGLGVMVGNMFGTTLAMIPALVVAQLCDFVDLDGPLHLTCDRLPALSFSDGRVELPRTPDWGGKAAL